MTGEWLRQWQQEHYRPQAMVVSLAGSFTQQHVDALVERLSSLPQGPTSPSRQAYYRSAVTVRKKAIEQNHLILAFPGLSYLDERRYQLLLLNSILGGGCSSRLFQQLREQRGLCYSVYSYVSDHADTGFLGIYTGLSREQEEPALETVRAIVSQLADQGPSQEELDRAREQAKPNILMGLESVQARMSHLGSSMLLYGRVREPEELLAAYDQVTREDLRTLSQEIFTFPRASLSAVGRVRSGEEYANWLEHGTF